jgi:hypothetical protein
VAELAAPFDSVYISFYKGLGAISGAMLMGDKAFIAEARVWLRRFGGNLYTLLPYAVSSWKGYTDKYVNANSNVNPTQLTFAQKHEKLARLVKAISKDKYVQQHANRKKNKSIVTFDPPVPVTCMVHGYLTSDLDSCHTALDAVEQEHNIRVLKRIRPVPSDHPVSASTSASSNHHYKCMFEWNMGDANGSIDDSHFLTGWRAFAKELAAIQKRQESNTNSNDETE